MDSQQATSAPQSQALVNQASAYASWLHSQQNTVRQLFGDLGAAGLDSQAVTFAPGINFQVPGPPGSNTTVNATWPLGKQIAGQEYAATIMRLSTGMSLEGHIVKISAAAQEAVKMGDIEAFRNEMLRGNILVDRNNPKGNLLDLAIYWLMRVLYAGNPVTGEYYVSPATLARMGMYFTSHGVTASPESTKDLDPPWLDFPPIAPEDIRILGDFFAKINERESPIGRIFRAFSFAIPHTGQLRVNETFAVLIGQVDGRVDLEKVIQDMAKPAEERYWAKKDLFSSGLEAVPVNALLMYEWETRVLGLPTEKETLDFIMQGPRTLIMRLFLHVKTNPIATKLLSNVIGLCWPLPLFREDFGDIMAMFAFRHEALSTWIKMLEIHRPTSEYLHFPGTTKSISGLITNWSMIGGDVRKHYTKNHKLHWASVGRRESKRDFEELLRPYVRAEGSEELFVKCKIFFETEF